MPRLSIVRATFSVSPGDMASISRVIKSRPDTLIALRCRPFNVPPTKPPMSFNLLFSDFGNLWYSSTVSVVRTGILRRSQNSDHNISVRVHCFDVRLAPILMVISLSFCKCIPLLIFHIIVVSKSCG